MTPEETKAVHRLRLVMIATLMAVTITISVLVWYFLSLSEQEEFSVAFETQGSKLVAGFKDDSFQKMQALDSLGSSLTNYAAVGNMTWPFVKVQNSHEFFTKFLSLANAASIKFAPIVGARQRTEWEEYVEENQEWVEQDLMARLEEQGGEAKNAQNRRGLQSFGGVDETTIVSPYIKNYVGVDTSPHQWMPWWQYAPVIENKWFLNFNQLADETFFREAQSVLDGFSVISETKTFVPGLDFQSTLDFTFTEELLAAGGFGQYEEGTIDLPPYHRRYDANLYKSHSSCSLFLADL